MPRVVTTVLEQTAVHLLGIRHHGPGSARSVLRVLNELQPDVVLVELPADCERPVDTIALLRAQRRSR